MDTDRYIVEIDRWLDRYKHFFDGGIKREY